MKESIYDNMTRCEKEVADLLKEMGIRWAYEKPVFVWDDNKRPRVWAPDRYLILFGCAFSFPVGWNEKTRFFVYSF